MPNWCQNVFQVEGDRSELDKFIDAVKSEDEPLSFASTVPEPETDEYKNSINSPSPFPLWYDWRVENWGCKWDVGNVSLEDWGDNQIRFIFDTPWGPPVEWLGNTCHKFPELTFTLDYRECGMGFQGYVECSEGKVVKNQEVEFRPTQHDSF